MDQNVCIQALFQDANIDQNLLMKTVSINLSEPISQYISLRDEVYCIMAL